MHCQILNYDLLWQRQQLYEDLYKYLIIHVTFSRLAVELNGIYRITTLSYLQNCHGLRKLGRLKCSDVYLQWIVIHTSISSELYINSSEEMCITLSTGTLYKNVQMGWSLFVETDSSNEYNEKTLAVS
jgi:hypothetical protein